ncbi:MAG: ATP synthase F1 subunit delta [Niabella sp.]
MPNPRLASRYAKALLDLAVEKGQLEQVYTDVQWMQQLCRQSREFVNLLRSPIIKTDKKLKIVNAITEGNIGEIVSRFNGLLVNKNRESFLPEVLEAFDDQYKEYKHISTVTLTTAVPVSDAVRNSIIARIKEELDDTTIELHEKVNPDIIGGFVLQSGDKLIDASIAYDLKEVGKQFKRNDFIYNVK